MKTVKFIYEESYYNKLNEDVIIASLPFKDYIIWDELLEEYHEYYWNWKKFYSTLAIFLNNKYNIIKDLDNYTIEDYEIDTIFKWFNNKFYVKYFYVYINTWICFKGYNSLPKKWDIVEPDWLFYLPKNWYEKYFIDDIESILDKEYKRFNSYLQDWWLICQVYNDEEEFHIWYDIYSDEDLIKLSEQEWISIEYLELEFNKFIQWIK